MNEKNTFSIMNTPFEKGGRGDLFRHQKSPSIPLCQRGKQCSADLQVCLTFSLQERSDEAISQYQLAAV
jgi:hypothetical protein